MRNDFSSIERNRVSIFACLICVGQFIIFGENGIKSFAKTLAVGIRQEATIFGIE